MKMSKNDVATVYSAIWKDGLIYSSIRKDLKENQVKIYSIKYLNDLKIYGISQNPDTKDYNGDVATAIWKDGPLYYLYDKKEWIRKPNKKVALKCLNSFLNANDCLNEVKAYLKLNTRFIINLYGISQDVNTGNYIMIFYYAEGGNLNDWLYVNDNYKEFSWSLKLKALLDVIQALKEIHQKQMVHRGLYAGSLLISTNNVRDFNVYISSMALCREVVNTDVTTLYGVVPSYTAPEVLRNKPYTKSADIYSFGMIMYFVATGKQPFSDYEHDHLIFDICRGIRPEINVPEAPKRYIDLMKQCWDSNPNNRPTAIKIEELITIFRLEESEEIKKQFKEAEEYRKENLKPNYDKYDDDNISNASSDIIIDFKEWLKILNK
ncbi:unnamed protein product [Rhizophagus irregularis]|nr:unnamed protein product [Rhizophagus irregularis]